MEKHANSVAYHDDLAGTWDERYSRGSFGRRARFFARDLLPLLPTGGHWLDAGCGTGTFSRMLAQQGRCVIGVDASPRMLTEAGLRAGHLADRLSFQFVETIEGLPFQAQHFDGIICLSVLEYLDDPLRALSEMGRVLKQGGIIVVSVPHRRSFLRGAQKVYARLRRERHAARVGYLAHSRFSIAPADMEKAIVGNGMSIRRSLGFDPLLPRIMHPLLHPSLVYLVCEKLHQVQPR